MPREHLAQPRSPAQLARTPRAAGEAIQAPCPAALTRRQPHAKRLRARAFTLEARRDCARTDGCCLASSQVHRSRPPSSTPTFLGSTRSVSSRSFEWCAARAARPPLTRTRSPAARSYPPRSATANHRLAAVERVLVSPCFPSHIPSCAGRLEYVMSDFVTRQRPPSAPRTAPSASRRCARVRTHATGCRVRERRFGHAVHVVRGVWRRSWAQSLRGRRDACGGVRHAACGGHAGERGRAARDLPARCRPAGGCGWACWQAHGVVWGTADPLVMYALPIVCHGPCLRTWSRSRKLVRAL